MIRRNAFLGVEMKKFIFIILFFALLTALSAANYIGFSNQYNFEIFAGGGWSSSTTIFSISPLLGFSHTIQANKMFSVENNFLFGYKYENSSFSGYDIYSSSDFHGFHFITNMNFFFSFGNNRVKFKFSVPSWIFSCGVGVDHYQKNEWNFSGTKRVTTYRTYVDYFVRGGIKVLYLGLDLYLGKQNNILFTPTYIYCVLFWGTGVFIIPFINCGIGLSLKFKINIKDA